MEAVTPDTWNTIEEFAAWFKTAGYPFRLPDDARVFVTDVSASIVVFRQDIYQAELYMMFPEKKIVKHHHPMKQVITFLGGWMRSYHEGGKETGDVFRHEKHQNRITPALQEGQWHSFDTDERGAFVFVLERWPQHGEEKSSATIAYDGPPLGPIHALTLKARK